MGSVNSDKNAGAANEFGFRNFLRKVTKMKKLYWLRRTGAMMFAFGIGAAITGNVPDWLKATYVCAIFGLVLIYDVAEYNIKKLAKVAD